MALYRNIAGFPDNSRIGLSLYQAPTLTIIDSSSFSLPSPFSDPVAYQEQQQAVQDATTTEINNRYANLMDHTYDENTAAGYYVDTTDGSIFQWTDGAHTTSVAYLPIQDIQRIENAAGTAGALLLHMQQPAIAKDTAGYESGNSTSYLTSQGVDPGTQTVSDPIPAVQTLPPVTSTTDGVTTTPTVTTTQTAVPTTTPKNNFLPLAILAGLGVVAIAGEPLLHKKRRLVFVGGIGALFYIMAKRT